VDDLANDLAPEGHSWVPVDVVAAAADPPAPPEIIELFYPGCNHLVSGESEALKTWLLLAAAAAELEEGRGVLWLTVTTSAWARCWSGCGCSARPMR
jgi:hypothetical protein